MSRPRVYRDPLYGQIKFRKVDLSAPLSSLEKPDQRLGWLVPNLIDCPEFQRLRHIRQNGLSNLVFYGMEHSRFVHSIGVSHLAGEMFDRIEYNMELPPEPDKRLETVTAGLLHDLGHGPFSHALEDALKAAGIPFHHETLTIRMMQEDTSINRILRQVDESFPSALIPFIDKNKRKPNDHWSYRLVSSQLDADRLDYLRRDASQAGLQGHGFDLPRLLDMLQTCDDIRVAVDRNAIEAVEAYLSMLEHAYQAIYFHRAIRGATVLLNSLMRRAVELYKSGEVGLFPSGTSGRNHPLCALIDKGQGVDLDIYTRLSEFHLWSVIEDWQWYEKDPILTDHAKRLMSRNRFRATNVDGKQLQQSTERLDQIKSIARQALPFVDERTINLYVMFDEPSRTGYKRYDWRAKTNDESIWLVGGGAKSQPIEHENDNAMFQALSQPLHIQRIMYPQEIHDQVLSTQ